MTLLWPGLPQKSAQGSLRQSLYLLRKHIPEIKVKTSGEIVPFFLADNQSIQVNPKAEVELDVRKFESILKGPVDTWSTAVSLYRGDFLTDFYLPDSAPFEEWVLAQREALRRQIIDALNQLAEEALAAANFDTAESYARRQIEIDNLYEEGYRLLMRALTLSGKRTEALTLYGDFEQLMEKEFRAKPSTATADLYEAILEGELYEDSAYWSEDKQTQSPLKIYHKQTVASLSGGRYQMDNRFVKLTLLLDQGVDAPGMRFVADEKQRKYDNLGVLLDEIEERTVVILGEPGSGKTTLLRHLQYNLAEAALRLSQDHTAFFVPLNGFRDKPDGQNVPEPIDWLAETLSKRYPELPEFRTLLTQGKLYLLLDGLNEMPHIDRADYRRRISYWRQFLQETRRYGNRVIFSCRTLDYSAPLSSTAVSVRQVRIESLSLAQIEMFINTYLPENGEAVWQQLQVNPQQLTLFSNPFFLRLLVEQIGDQGKFPGGEAALLTGFIRRALQREVTEQSHPLFEPGNMLSEGDYEQVLRNEWLTPHELPWGGELFPQLERLAFVMQDGRESEGAGQVRILEREAIKLLDHPRAQDAIQAGIQLNIIDKEIATRELTFSHQLIQEYFAARLLAQHPDPTKVAVSWRADEIQPSLSETVAGLEKGDSLPAAPTTGWEETMELAAAMSQDQEQFVHDLLPVNLPLAARCAALAEVDLPRSFISDIQQALIKRIATPETDLRARITTANSLGCLGDPRFERRSGPHGPYLRPSMALIPGGTYPMGSDYHLDIEYKAVVIWTEFEQPAYMVEVAPFEIGIFPVTNAEYRFFLESGGYEDERWWPMEAARTWLREGGYKAERQGKRDSRVFWQSLTEEQIKSTPGTPETIEHWLWQHNVSDDEFEAWLIEEYPAGVLYHQPRYWHESRFNQPAQPVVSISWFEALAYCTWLSAQTGEKFDLPTEAEWKAAARGADGRAYAFGNMFEPSHCNTFETHIRCTTPVGVFPTGRTPEGVFDLSGNVEEWTTTIWSKRRGIPDYHYPYKPGDNRENREEETDERRVVCGGNWFDDQYFVHTAIRSGLRPATTDISVGIRLVVRRPSAHPAP